MGAVGLLVLVAAACSGGEDEPAAPATTAPAVVEVGGVPVRAGHAHPAGTPLRGGLVVPEGAVLLGAPVPLEPSTTDGEVGDRWEALLLVTGPLDAAVDDVVAQAEALGAEGSAGCWSVPADEPPGFPAADGCRGRLRWPDRRLVTIVAERRESHLSGVEAEGPLPALSHVLLRWEVEPDASPPPERPPADEPGLPVPDDWAVPAGPGEPLRGPSPGLRREGAEVVLPAGAFVVGPLWSDGELVRSVLVVDGDVAGAMDALAAEIVARYSTNGTAEAGPATVHEVDGTTVRRQVVRYDLSSYVLTAVGRYLVVDQHPLD